MSDTQPIAWQVGDRLVHRFNTDLGPGRVVAVEGRTLVVEFPASATTLRIAGASDALEPLVLRPGDRVRLEASGETATVAGILPDATCRLDDGRVVHSRDLWPLQAGESPVDRLARGDIDPVEDFANRLDGLHLSTVREADDLGSFLGGRIRLYPHQLHAAERATRADPVRWLLADEVGLGKTVEACLILNRLVHTGRADRVLVVAPDSLTVQWLGELWRKHHQVFVLLDTERLEDVERVYGAGFNPFDAHRRAIVSVEMLVGRKDLARQAVEAALDLLVVDEAHHLRRPPGHPGNPVYRALEPITRGARHLLLLTATPLEDDAQGFYRLLQLLRPDEFREDSFAQRLERGGPLPACTSATRRADIGGLPPRVHRPAEIDRADAGWQALAAVEAWARGQATGGALTRRAKIERLRRALSAPAGLLPLLRGNETEGRRLCEEAARRDPRVRWLARHLRAWREAGDKTLVFVARREALVALREALERQAQVKIGIFHEEMSAARRDIEVAQLRRASGPSVLISTECGGEGRNFEFCRRLVLFDLPWNPMTVEQRIGRLDRIGRDRPVEIVTFHPPGGLGAEVADLMASLDLFREPLSSLARHVEGVEPLIEAAAQVAGAPLADDARRQLDDDLRAARDRLRQAAARELHRDPYRPDRASAILARVPGNLDELTEDVVVAACERSGFDVERQRGERTWAIELGARALLDHLPGVSGGNRFLGTFSREVAVANETLDFFASGHPLVEGVLAELEDSPRGRVALLHLPGSRQRGSGLLALYRRAAGFEAVAIDLEGRRRPEWAARLLRRPLRMRRPHAADWCRQPGWAGRIERLARALPEREHPLAVAFFVLGEG